MKNQMRFKKIVISAAILILTSYYSAYAVENIQEIQCHNGNGLTFGQYIIHAAHVKIYN